MNRTKIEWCDYTINPVKGLCPMACPYCYARRMYKRFKWNPEIRYEEEVFLKLGDVPIGGKVFVGSTMELFMPQFESWTKRILHICSRWDDRTFIFLTKQPQNLPPWSPFPENCLVGVTAVDHTCVIEAHHYLANIQAGVKFLSIEPLLEWHPHSNLEWLEGVLKGINWIIIGACTPYSPKTAPKIEWVQEILVAAHNAGNIPVFMKNNLQPLLDKSTGWGGWKLRQEFPNSSTT